MWIYLDEFLEAIFGEMDGIGEVEYDANYKDRSDYTDEDYEREIQEHEEQFEFIRKLMNAPEYRPKIYVPNPTKFRAIILSIRLMKEILKQTETEYDIIMRPNKTHPQDILVVFYFSALIINSKEIMKKLIDVIDLVDRVSFSCWEAEVMKITLTFTDAYFTEQTPEIVEN